MFLRMLGPFLEGTAVGALAGAVFFTLFGVVWALAGGRLDVAVPIGLWGVLCGAVSGGVMGVCRTLDRCLTDSDTPPDPALAARAEPDGGKRLRRDVLVPRDGEHCTQQRLG
jgi:hypothetical protein